MILASYLIGAPRWVIPAAVCVAVILLLVGLGYRRASATATTRIVAMLLKVAGVVLLAICLIEPLFSGVRPRPGANLFIVLTDNSQSMTVRSGSRVRGDEVRTLLDPKSSWRTRLEQGFDVRDYVFDTQLKHLAEPAEVLFDGTGSALHSALDTVATRFQQRPVAGVLLLSDGNATDLVRASDFEFPIYPLVDDDSAALKDIRIGPITVTQTNFEASPITVNANVSSQGFDESDITVRIVDRQGTEIQKQLLRLEDQQPRDVRLRFRPPESGLSFFRLEVFPTDAQQTFERGEPAAEVTLANNTRWISVDRGGGPYRVLYVSGRPNWEFKFLRRSLDEDDEIRLSGLQRIAKKQPKFVFGDRGGVSDRNQLFEGFDGKDDEDAESYDQPVLIRLGVEEDELRDGFPKDAEVLFAYHAIILDDIEARFFSPIQMSLVQRFVSQRGGGLMMLGGQESFAGGGYHKTQLGEVLPVYVNRSGPTSELPYRWDLTREGWLQDWTRLRATEAEEKKRLAELPGFRTINHVDGLKPGASLLAAVGPPGGTQVPALVTQRFGKGRSAALLVGDLWRWTMRRQDPQQQDLQQLWRQVVRWLVADVPKRVETRVNHGRGATGPVTVEVVVRDEEFQAHDNADVQVKVTTPSGDEFDLTAEASPREAGLYAVDYWPHEDGPFRAVAQVTTAGGEELDPRDAGWTSEPAADEFRQLDTNRELLANLASESGGELVPVGDLDEFVASLPDRKVPITETWVYPLWHQPWVLALAIGCLCGEWGLRRWKGLP